MLTELRQHMAAALGRADGWRWDQVGEQEARLKVEVSEELLGVCGVLEPGLSKCRGITLMDLAEARGRLIHLTEEGPALLRGLQVVERELEEADTILRLEDETSIEGGVARIARQQLQLVKGALGSLRAQGGKEGWA